MIACEQGFKNPAGSFLGGLWANYRIYECSDGKRIAFAGFEEKFWDKFCEIIGIESSYPPENIDIHRQVEKIIKTKSSSEWDELLTPMKICFSKVREFESN